MYRFIVATILLASTAIVLAGPSENGAKLYQEASSQADTKSSSPMKTLMSDSGELSVMAKRRSGFLPSRGKKDAEPFADEAGVDGLDDAARADFLNEAAKRSRGFLPMRGRKSEADAMDFEEMMEKRRVASFMPMRGRKWDAQMALGQPESSMPVPSNAIPWYPRFYHPVSFSVGNAPQPAPMMYYPFKADSASYYNEDQQPAMDAIEKRKGMGFFGARGKRSVL